MSVNAFILIVPTPRRKALLVAPEGPVAVGGADTEVPRFDAPVQVNTIGLTQLMTQQGGRFWTTSQLAEEARKRGKRVTSEYIRQLCSSGEIRAEKPGRDWLIPDREAQKWLEQWLGEN